MKVSRKVNNAVEYAAFRSFLFLLKLFPYNLSKIFLLCLFDLVGYKIGFRRKVAELQLNDIFPTLSNEKKQAIIRNVYRNMALNVAEIYLMSDADLFAKTTFVNTEYVYEALERKKGVLLITGHFGDWEAPCRMLPMKGFGLAMITKKQRNNLFDDYTNAIRERQGGKIIDMKNALRGVLEHTGHNDLIGILIDQDAGKRGVLADFLGKPASNWKGTAKIALKFKIPIVSGYVIRNKDESLTFSFDKMIDPLLYEDTEENLLEVIRLMNKTLEDRIREYPELWFWVHKRWKGARHFLPKEQVSQV
jgi:KDO2-lipid IV(A) lauroyltransferase